MTDTAKKFLYEERKYAEDVINTLRICSIDDEKRFVDTLVRKFGTSRVLKCQLAYKHSTYLCSYFHAPCLFFPYFDIEGNIVGLQARYLGDIETHQRFQFPKGTETHIFNQPICKELAPQEPLFIAEGVTDAIALLSSGYKAIAIPSATLLKKDELKDLVTHPLMMYPDNDEPGERLFKQIESSIKSIGGSITRLILPNDCKDFSEFFVKHKFYIDD